LTVIDKTPCKVDVRMAAAPGQMEFAIDMSRVPLYDAQKPA
jgi:hypothetical protein